ncbi:hypothetical protein FQN52_003869 [Onygenales sp. PD_12]|nr:hypothetical protein FQN53_006835 [Emmonsiellopsis sp. PD_33]KAK2775841.1 hypothetical protein FQN52_003869 [Onygenales sp. PD_12]KAK2805756.1 hypothetical protein FQN51_009259 [Onygenales sp. PD_10]
MQLTNTIAIVALLATSAVASPRGGYTRPQRPSSPTYQSISCSSGSAFCCAPESTFGTTCTAMTGTSVSCNSLIVCCNNNGDGTQLCSANLQQPVQFVSV